MTASLLLEHFDQLISAPDNVEKLNRSILDLAVRGKLTCWEPSDIKIDDYLREIELEKNKFAGENGFKKDKPFPSIRDDEKRFDIPEHWKWVRLNDICVKITDGFHETPKPTEEGYPYVLATHVKSKGIDFDNCFYVSDADHKRLFTKATPRKGDVLVVSIGAGSATPAIIDVDFEFSFKNVAILNKASSINTKYLFYYLLAIKQSVFDEITRGGAQPYLSLRMLKNLVFPLAPLAEQQRIVARVEELFAQTRVLAKELAHSQSELDGLNKSALSQLLASKTLEEFNEHWAFIAEYFDLLFQAPEHVAPLRQSILELAVRGKLTRREAGDESAKELLKQISAKKEKPFHLIRENEKPYELPSGWEWTKFESIANIATNSVQPDEFRDFPHVAPNNIEKGTGRLLDYKTVAEDDVRSINHRFFPGQLLYSKIRPNLSKAVIVDFEGLCSADMYPLDVFIDTQYLLYFILSSVFLRMVTKSDTRVAMPKVNQNELNKVWIAVPPLAEQERIVKRVEQLLSLCDALEARLQSAQEERGRLVESVLAKVGG